MFGYSLGIFLGIQIGKEMNLNKHTLYNKRVQHNNSDYYKNYQIDYRYNK